MMKKQLLLLVMIFLPIVASAYDIAIKNADGVTIYYNYSSDGASLIVTSGSYSGTVVIPEKITYKNRTLKVTSIGDGAFAYCEGLTSIKIPNSVTSIGKEAFDYCSGLTSIKIPNSVTIIGSNAFQDCSGLTSIEIPNSVTSIGEWAFSSCRLISVTIPNSVTSIGVGTFSDCRGLISVTIPNSVTSIGDCAFDSCKGLTSVTIPNSVTSIGRYAFAECSGLTSIEIPNSVTSIGSSAFQGCSGLTSVTIPNGVITIGKDAFKDCRLLKRIKRVGVVQNVNAQKDAAVSASKQTEAKVATYVGGETAMRRFIASTLKYPVIAEENGEQGTVVVGFTVEEDGSLTNIHIEKSVSEWLDKEAKRIVSKMPKWQPAQSGGVNVKSEQTVIVTFILQ